MQVVLSLKKENWLEQEPDYRMGKLTMLFNHLSGYCCMWKAIFAPRYLGADAEVVKK